ncbi:GntR family transcriptional regulator [Rhizobium sp. CFBP 8762]|uniref:GntR family transcriptional regulator n=1 Tax=Rhizobium sp. CFBP 8762 TaxID=2775279 RepID=UPI0017821CBC|nr:GntR family transcriptional regulator [Rhizobium sp. CFBP 8762]MBD8555063.1 GntR family transcriptional regulator [Rhizobium sp. CFBP 8762]
MTTNGEMAHNGAEPLHQQLKAIILKSIASGEWPPHSQIASERELCERYSVSRTTTRKVLSDLIHDGLVYTVSGKGTFVAEHRLRQELKPLVGFTQDLRDQGVDVVSEVMSFERIEADESLAAHLKIRPFAAVVKLQRCRCAGDQPLAIQTTYLPEHLCPGVLRYDFASHSLFETLRQEFGLEMIEGKTVIKPGLAEHWEAKTLNVQQPAAVLRTFQTTFLEDGQVIEYCVSAFHGELFELTVGGNADRTININTAYSTGNLKMVTP